MMSSHAKNVVIKVCDFKENMNQENKDEKKRGS